MPLPPGVGTGFTSVGDYIDANRGTLANEGGQITSDVGGTIDAAKDAADTLIAGDRKNYQQDYTGLPGYGDALDKAIAAKDESTALGSPGGVSDYFQRKSGDSKSQGDFDASLLGFDASGLKARAGSLTDYLNGGLAAVQAPNPGDRADNGNEPMPPGTHHSPPGSPGYPVGPPKPGDKR